MVHHLSDLDFNKTYTYADYLTWQFEQTVELIKGKIMPMSAPSRLHQDISREICGIFYGYFKGKPCRFYDAPFDVRLLDNAKSTKANKKVFTVVQPDICVVCDSTKLDQKGCIGSPDLMVEILSPGNSKREMSIKKRLYEENSIPEYWIIDPEHESVLQFILNDKGLYNAPNLYVSDDILISNVFPTLQIDLQDIFKHS